MLKYFVVNIVRSLLSPITSVNDALVRFPIFQELRQPVGKERYKCTRLVPIADVRQSKMNS